MAPRHPRDGQDRLGRGAIPGRTADTRGMGRTGWAGRPAREGAPTPKGWSEQAGQGGQLGVFLQALVILLFKNVFMC